MKRILLIAITVLGITGCAVVRNAADGGRQNPYDNPFYAKYLNTGSNLDAQISRTLEALRAEPDSPELHNTLGALLVEKGFPKDAERELERAVNANRKYYPAWYNLGLVRAARGDELGARRAFSRTVDLKPGHAAALFQLGLIEEERDHIDRAVALYAKAYAINPALLDVEVNPRILDTNLTHLALLKLYPNQHTHGTMNFQGGIPAPGPAAAPSGSSMPAAPSPQPAPKDIVTPAPPATDRGVRPAASVVPAEQSPLRRDEPPPPRDTRGRRRRAQQEAEQSQPRAAEPTPAPAPQTYQPSATSPVGSTQ